MYCTTDDIITKTNFEITTESKPSIYDVDILCDEVSTYLDKVLESLDITIPVTDSKILSLLKTISINGVLAEFYRIYDQTETANLRQSLFTDAVNEIKRSPELLMTKSSCSPSGSTAKNRPFKRGEKIW